MQDRLAGKKGAFAIIGQALEHLIQAGYPSEIYFSPPAPLSAGRISTNCRDLWQWLRAQNIEPYFEILTPQANALENTWLSVEPTELRELFVTALHLDRERFGRIWEPQPPLVGNRCMRHQVSCVVTANGDVMPCVGVTIPLGSIRNQQTGRYSQKQPGGQRSEKLTGR